MEYKVTGYYNGKKITKENKDSIKLSNSDYLEYISKVRNRIKKEMCS